ncbi:hypothetical protein ACTMU2_22655 [Cupriavidus basilensis]
MVLMRLFQTSRRFNVEIQPQLARCRRRCSISKAWVASSTRSGPVEDRQAVPRALDARAGRLEGARERIKVEAPLWAKMLPDFPRLAHQFLERRALNTNGEQERLLAMLVTEQRRTQRLVGTTLLLVGGFIAGIVLTHVLGLAGYW